MSTLRLIGGVKPGAVKAASPVLNGGDEETGLFRPRLVATQLESEIFNQTGREQRAREMRAPHSDHLLGCLAYPVVLARCAVWEACGHTSTVPPYRKKIRRLRLEGQPEEKHYNRVS
jgi:hypothetical protein